MRVYKQRCKNCLLSEDRIVSPEKAQEIINDCVKKQSFFICHKSPDGKEIMCRGYYKKYGNNCLRLRIAELIGMVNFIEQPDEGKLLTHNEMSGIMRK